MALFRETLDGGSPQLPTTLGLQIAPSTRARSASLNNLAEVRRAQGELAGAWALLERAHEASRRRLGEDHPLTATIAGNLAALGWWPHFTRDAHDPRPSPLVSVGPLLDRRGGTARLTACPLGHPKSYSLQVFAKLGFRTGPDAVKARFSCGLSDDGRYWARTSDPQLVELARGVSGLSAIVGGCPIWSGILGLAGDSGGHSRTL